MGISVAHTNQTKQRTHHFRGFKRIYLDLIKKA